MRRLLVVLGLVVVAWVVFTGVTVTRAVLDARSAKQLLDNIHARADVSTIFDPDVVRDLKTSRHRLDRAASNLRQPLLAPLRVLPFVGRQVHGVTTLADVTSQIAGIGV